MKRIYKYIACFLFTFIKLDAFSQTPEIDSLQKQYNVTYHIYDSCFKRSRFLLEHQLIKEFWDNQSIQKYALRKCASIDDLIVRKREIWLYKRADSIQKK